MKRTDITPEEKSRRKTRHDWLWAAIIGVGLALFPVHNQALTALSMNSKGEAWFFLPAFATILWLMGSMMFLADNWSRVKAAGWGDRRIVVLLLVIVAAMGLSGITAPTLGAKVAPLFMGAALFSLYLTSRVLGRAILLPIAVGAAAASIGVLVSAALDPGVVTGGLVFEQNYDIVVGVVLLGAAVLISRWRPVLAGLAVLAMFFTGSPEAVFSVAILAIALVWRRDWSKRVAAVLGIVILMVGVWFALGHGGQLYSYSASVVANGVSIAQDPEWLESPKSTTMFGDRITKIQRAAVVFPDRPLGIGYSATKFDKNTVHNVPLIILQQLGWFGALAAVAWVGVGLWGLLRTKWKYAWLLVFSLSVWDHFVWTQIGPWWWALAGVSSVGGIESDLVFRRENT